MKRKIHIQTSTLVAGLLALALVNVVQADDGILLGVKAGVVDIESPGYDSITTASFLIGYEFIDLLAADFAIEAEVTQSISAADGPGGEFDYTGLGLFAALRSAGPIYVTGRVGVVNARVDQASGDTDETNFAWGLGVGFSTGVRWELEWTNFEFNNDDVTQINLSLSF